MNLNEFLSILNQNTPLQFQSYYWRTKEFILLHYKLNPNLLDSLIKESIKLEFITIRINALKIITQFEDGSTITNIHDLLEITQKGKYIIKITH